MSSTTPGRKILLLSTRYHKMSYDSFHFLQGRECGVLSGEQDQWAEVKWLVCPAAGPATGPTLHPAPNNKAANYVFALQLHSSRRLGCW